MTLKIWWRLAATHLHLLLRQPIRKQKGTTLITANVPDSDVDMEAVLVNGSCKRKTKYQSPRILPRQRIILTIHRKI